MAFLAMSVDATDVLANRKMGFDHRTVVFSKRQRLLFSCRCLSARVRRGRWPGNGWRRYGAADV